MASVLDALNGRCMFITGSTGFVGKVFLEKLLRCVPGIRTIYLLVRPGKGCSAKQRFRNEVLSSHVFSRLRSEIGDAEFERLADEKLVVVSGDLTQKCLGISEAELAELRERLNVIYHVAASIEFNLRLDMAAEMNVYGTMRVFDLADSCAHLEAVIHISTAYTNCTQSGVVQEVLYPCSFDIPAMLATISRLSNRELQKVTVDGLIGDWPNTYTFTKFIAEHMIAKRCKGARYATAIVRPTIIAGAWLEPFPGWVDVISAAGAIFVTVGLGLVTALPGKATHIGDVVPVDFVVNGMLVALPGALSHPDRFFICQVAASSIKPWRWQNAIDCLPAFWMSHPSAHTIGPVKFSMVSNPTLYDMHMLARYALPSAILNAVALVGTAAQKRKAAQFQKVIVKVNALVDAFRYFTEREWQFEFKNLVPVAASLPPEEQRVFWLDISELDYTQFMRSFSYGLIRFVLKEDLIDLGNPLVTKTVCLHETTAPEPGILSRIMPGVAWSRQQIRRNGSVDGPTLGQMKASVLASPRIQDILAKQVERQQERSMEDAMQHAASMLEVMIGETKPSVITGMAVTIRRLLKRLYSSVLVNQEGVDGVKQALSSRAGEIPLIYVPTHRSYMDFLLVSYICFVYNLPVPYIAAGNDFLDVAVVNWLFRHSGAFFIRRSFAGDVLYKALFEEYIRQLLCMGKSIEFYIEGGRSRSGKMLQPRLGILQSVVQTVLNGDVRDALVVPISINYEKTLEASAFSNELHGNSKIKETLRNLVGATSSVLTSKFGRVSIRIGEPQSIVEFANGRKCVRTVNRALAYSVSFTLQSLCEIMPTHMVATLLLMFRRGISRAQLVSKLDWLRREILTRGGRVILFETQKLDWIVAQSLELLRDVVEEKRQNFFEAKIWQPGDYPNLLLLGHYRNKLFHVFFRESIWACALHSIGLDNADGVSRDALFDSTAFLFKLLKREVLNGPDPDGAEDFESSFQEMISRGVFTLLPNGHVEIASESMFSFLCALCWPFIDSYYATGLLLHTLEGPVEESQVLHRTQWLATTLYHESIICFYESCSSDTLRNALTTFQEEFGVACRTKQVFADGQSSKGARAKPAASTTQSTPVIKTEISLTSKFQDGELLQQLIHRIDLVRKRPPVTRSSLRRAMIAEIPLLAKL